MSVIRASALKACIVHSALVFLEAIRAEAGHALSCTCVGSSRTGGGWLDQWAALGWWRVTLRTALHCTALQAARSNAEVRLRLDNAQAAACVAVIAEVDGPHKLSACHLSAGLQEWAILTSKIPV